MRCDICEIGCQLAEGQTGKCGQYIYQGDEIQELYPDCYLTVCPISIETMPVLHFHPRGKFMQVSSTGCNFQCPGCVSTVIVREMSPQSSALHHVSAEELVAHAIEEDCQGLAFLMNDPLASYPSFLRVAKEARAKGLMVGCSSNAYFTEKSLQQIIDYLDFINIGIKGNSDASYQYCGAKSAEPVWRNIKILHEKGVHVEVSFVFEKGGEEEIMSMAQRLASISDEIPLQLMRLIPLEKVDPAREPSIREAEALCRRLRSVLKHVYLFNSPGTEYLSTYCASCGTEIYQRDFYGPMGAKIRAQRASIEGDCLQCGTHLAISGMGSSTAYQEGDFQGGYPFTRALEMIEAILLAIQVRDKSTVIRVWESLLLEGRLEGLHRHIQQPASYLEVVRYCGEKSGHNVEAQDLIDYIQSKLQVIEEALSGVDSHPRVYYAMGKPLFCIKGERMENQLVKTAGGQSVNMQLDCSGRPGMKIDAALLNQLDPQYIFISAFLSSSVEDFTASCYQEGIEVEALKKGRIYSHPAPGWDFGSPRWILGLMNIANLLHPERCHFDVMAEAREFYQHFYHLDFKVAQVNRSFAKPATDWDWDDK